MTEVDYIIGPPEATGLRLAEIGQIAKYRTYGLCYCMIDLKYSGASKAAIKL